MRRVFRYFWPWMPPTQRGVLDWYMTYRVAETIHRRKLTLICAALWLTLAIVWYINFGG